MNTFVRGVLIVLLSLAASMPGLAASPEEVVPPAVTERGTPLPRPVQPEAGYTLNPGDQINVSVWKEEGLDRPVLVLPDGSISFPLVGEIQAVGKTVDDLQRDITEQLKRYIPDAVVTVAVLNTAGNKIFVLGEVARPGEYPLTRPTSVMQALSMAGGLTPFAGENRIRILRHSGEGQQTIPFPYGTVSNGESLETNILLRGGDVIVVPGRSLF